MKRKERKGKGWKRKEKEKGEERRGKENNLLYLSIVQDSIVCISAFLVNC